MRKNKFAYPYQKDNSKQLSPQSPNTKKRNHPLIQNKIYFPATYQDKLMPYKIQSSYHKNNTNFNSATIDSLYDVKEKVKNQTKSRKFNFGRENKFQKVQINNQNQTNKNISKRLIKYNTIQLKNLPGISYTASGTTIYRSKNIKSSSKLLIEKSLSRRGKSQFRRNMSLRNDQSVQTGIYKSKSNKQTNCKFSDKKLFLYQTYFSSKSGLNLRSNSCRPFDNGDYIEQLEQNPVNNPEDILFENIIKTEIYGNSDFTQQQYFF